MTLPPIMGRLARLWPRGRRSSGVLGERQATPPETGNVADPLEAQAAEPFAVQLAANRIPSVRAIRSQLHVGQPRAQRLRDHRAVASGMYDEGLAA
jgi:hypothetical protein